MSIFPFIEAGTYTPESLTLYRDIQTDKDGIPVFTDGEPRFVTGNEALKTWCRFALLTERKKYIQLPWSYGSDADKLIGKGFLPGTTESEIKRYVKECLTANPYIKSVTEISVGFSGNTLSGNFKIKTIYGEDEVYV